MIFSDIWHKYYSWYFEIVIGKGEWNLRQFWNITSGIYVKYHVQIMLLFVYTTTRKRFVIFTCKYFKLSWNHLWNTTALSHSNCRNFPCSSIMTIIWKHFRRTVFQSSFLSFVTFEMLGREINLFYKNLWYCHSQIIFQVPLLTKWTRQPWQSPFKRQYLHTNSPNWSLYFSFSLCHLFY